MDGGGKRNALCYGFWKKQLESQIIVDRMPMRKRYVAKAEAGKGWRVWNRKTQKWWGNYFKYYPELLLDELNGEKNPEEITKLNRRYQMGMR